jgi:type IV pilus assembly protein PilB
MGAKDGVMGRFLGNAEKFSDKQVAETLEMLVKHGVERNASDIHIEPHERFILVRYRIDGTLRGIHKLPRAALGTVMVQLKKMADLSANETQAPQEGRYHVRVGEQEVEVRLSTMPVFGGEKAVLHLSIQLGKPQDLEKLGFWGQGLRTLQTVLTTPHGLVVIAGPRHSGISSTLFSLLNQLNSPLVSVATVETRAKHHLPGITQTYTGSTMSVLEGVQAALKQDPNIVMINDIPDSQTAELAIHAATTGHLLLTGMHAENSLAAVLRLRAAGVEPFLLANGLRASISQRLVRRLCTVCRIRTTPTAEEQKELAEQFGISTPSARKRIYELERLAAPAIFGDVKQLSSSPAGITYLWKANSDGCEQCHHSGYDGRMAIVEVLEATEGLQRGLMNRDVTSVAALQKIAVKDNFIPMALDGLIKALLGQTTTSEVLRAVHTPA